MGLPVAYKRARRSHSPEAVDSAEASSVRESSPWDGDCACSCDWACRLTQEPGLLDAAAKPSTLPLMRALQGGAHPASTRAPGAHARHSPMESLPEALLVKILQFSQPTAWDLCRMSCVSKKWRSACGHKSFWTRLRVGRGSLRTGVEQLAPRCTELEEIFLDDPHCELHVLHPIVIACALSLRRVVIDCDRDSGSRNEASISSVLWLISLYCKNVESIELQSNGGEATAGNLEGRTMWYLTSAFRGIRYFASLARGSLTRQCIYLMAIAWRDLECVRLNMDGLATEDLLALRKCERLKAIELVGGTLNPICSSALHHLPVSAPPGGLPSAARAPLAGFPSGSDSEESASSLTGEFPVPMHGGSPLADERHGYASDGPAEFCSSHQSQPSGEPSMTDWHGRARMNGDSQGSTAVHQGHTHHGGHHRHGHSDAPTSAASAATAAAAGLSYCPLFHPTLELLVLNRVRFDVETVAVLALSCPNLKRILVSGALCVSCLVHEGPCRSLDPECVRKRVDLIQQTLAQVRVSLQQ